MDYAMVIVNLKLLVIWLFALNQFYFFSSDPGG